MSGQSSRPIAEAAPGKTESNATKLALLKKNITDSVMNRIQPLLDAKQLRVPANYAVGNALQDAWFVLLETKTKDKKPVLEACTHESIANSLYRMVTWGLSASKQQVAFVAYGDKLVCQQEYHGKIALAKRLGTVKQVNAGVVYQNDVFKYAVNTETGRKKIIEHSQELENIDDGKIRGAYAVLTFEDGSEPYVEVMSFPQIRVSWEMGQQKGQGDVHKNFSGEMCKKTVISRACKLFITGSDDASLFDDDEYNRDYHKENRDEKVQLQSGKKQLAIDSIDFQEVAPSQAAHVEYKQSEEQLTTAAPEPVNAGPDY